MELATAATQSGKNYRRRWPRESSRGAPLRRTLLTDGPSKCKITEGVITKSKENLDWMARGMAEVLWANQTYQQRMFSSSSDFLLRAKEILSSFFDDEGKPKIPCDVAVSHIVGFGKVGFSLVAQMPNYLTGEPEARIVCIFVEKEHRGQGIGKLNLKCCMDWARERSLKTISAEVGAANPAALRLFRSAGLIPVSHVMARDVETVA